MRKSVYIIIAVLIAVALTLVQSFIAGAATKKNEIEMIITKKDIRKGSIITEKDIIKSNMYLAKGEQNLVKTEYDSIIGSIAAHDIHKGGILTERDIISSEGEDKTMRRISLAITGENFNAYDITQGDYVDIYIIPDMDKLNEASIIWINDKLSASNIAYVPMKEPGIMIENIRVEHIDSGTGGTAKYASIKVKKPIDEAISYLKRVGEYEFIKR